MKNTIFRLTRSAFRRKAITFGVSIFASIAMMASGFAAWVLSQEASMDANGEIEVGVITEANIGISEIVFAKDAEQNDIKSFLFEPAKDDTTGRVRWDGSVSERLALTISWNVTNYQSAADHYVQFKLPASVKAAIDANYIKAPEGFTISDVTEEIGGVTYYVATYAIGANLDASKTSDDKQLTYKVTTDEDDRTIKNLACTLELEFAWGTKFGETNPSLYFDNTDIGKAIEYDNVKKELETFKATLHGITYEEYAQLSESDRAALTVSNYQVVIVATVQ